MKEQGPGSIPEVLVSWGTFLQNAEVKELLHGGSRDRELRHASALGPRLVVLEQAVEARVGLHRATPHFRTLIPPEALCVCQRPPGSYLLPQLASQPKQRVLCAASGA